MIRIIKKESFIKLVKYVLCIGLLFFMIKGIYNNGIDQYYKYHTKECINTAEVITTYPCSNMDVVKQNFFAKGNNLNDVKVYISQLPANQEGKLVIQISEMSGKLLSLTETFLSDITSDAWYKINVNTANLKTDETYQLIMYLEDTSDSVNVTITKAEDTTLDVCTIGDEQIPGQLYVGLVFVEKYMELPYVMTLCVELLVSLFFSILLMYIIIHVEEFYFEYKMAKVKRGLAVAILMSVSWILQYNPLEKVRNQVDSFDRVMGAGLGADVDISKVVNNFYSFFFLFIIAVCGYTLFFHHVMEKDHSLEDKKAFNYFDKLLSIAYVNLILRCITYFLDQTVYKNVFYYSTSLVSLYMIFVFAYVILKLDRKLTFDTYNRLFYIMLGISYPIAIWITLEWGDGRLLFGINLILAFAIVVIVLLCKNFNIQKMNLKFGLDSATVIVCSIPLVTSFYIELLNILNQHEIYISSPKIHYFNGILMMAVLSVVCYFILRKKGINFKDWKKFAYPELLIGISFLSIQVPLTQTLGADIFEGANYSILISDFLNYGKLPIVSHYGGHMLSDFIGGVLYGLVNRDIANAIFIPYSVYILPILTLVFFYLIKNLIDEDYAFWIVLIIPFYNYWAYFGLGIIICLATIRFIKRRTYGNAFLIWATCGACTLYRLDLGTAYGMAVVATLAICMLFEKDKIGIKKLVISFLSVIGAVALCWIIICILSGINPISRLMEFVQISLSNQNWAYGSIGNSQNTVFSWSYLFIPLIVIGALVYTIICKEFRTKIGDSRFIILLMLGMSYFFNFSRGCVRHNLTEMATYVVIWSGYLFVAAFLTCLFDNKKVFIFAFSGFMLLNNLFLQDTNFSQLSIVDNSSSRIGKFVETWVLGRFEKEEINGSIPTSIICYSTDEKKAKRIIWSNELKEEILPIKEVCDLLLDNNETYLDFVNKTFMYSAMGRECPVYVSQSPGHLSGVYTQEKFVEEIKSDFDNIPIAIMPNTLTNNSYSVCLDGISNISRYYIVSEFIYQNYRPLCSVNDVGIWCQNDRYDEYKGIIEGNNERLVFITKDNIFTISANNCTARIVEELESKNMNNQVELQATGEDPYISNFQNLINNKYFDEKEIKIKITYKSTVHGIMQLYFTSEVGGEFSENNSISIKIGYEGVAEFSFKVSENTKLRLDFPKDSILTIESIKVGIELIEWGYDGPVNVTDPNGNAIEYTEYRHSYPINQLPYMWAEFDEKNAIENEIISETTKNEKGVYEIVNTNLIEKDEGNYLQLSCNYTGTDGEGLEEKDDETCGSVIKVGTYTNEKFIEKYQFKIALREGRHNYLIRISSDYYWYTENINAITFSSEGQTNNVTMKVIEGDTNE